MLEPGAALRWGRALDAICLHLEAVADGRITRLLVNCPPGMMKSLLTGVFFPAWLWGPKGRPHARFIGSCYSDAYAARDARRMRDLVLVALVPGPVGRRGAADPGGRDQLRQRGHRLARGGAVLPPDRRPGRLPGPRRPALVAEAESAAERERTVRLFRESVTTRLNDPERTAIVVIMQRLHERDIAGVILAGGLGYEALVLPMEFEPERRCRTSIGFADWREREGELLFPERFPAAVVARDKAAMGSYAVAAQFQQRPAPRGGGLIRVENIPAVDDWPRDAAQVRRWDFAASEARPGADPDWTAGVRLAWKDGRCWVVDVRRERLSPRGVELLVRATAERGRAGRPGAARAGAGQLGLAVLDHYRRGVLAGYAAYASRVTGSKVQRAGPFAAAVEAGNVLLVRGAWNDAFVDECRTFPAGAHDDQVDAAADGFAWLGAAGARGGRLGRVGGTGLRPRGGRALVPGVRHRIRLRPVVRGGHRGHRLTRAARSASACPCGTG